MTGQFDETDTSNNQGAGVVRIGPAIVAAGGVGWSAKVSQGRTYRDPYWPACRQARVDVGIPYGGGYHWLTPTASVADQFDNYVGWMGALWDGDRTFLDVEDPQGLPDSMVFEAIDRWAEHYGMGRLAIYTGRWYMPDGHSYLIDRVHARYGDDLAWILPWYTSSFPGGMPFEPVMWQYAGGQQGISLPPVGQVDSNQYINLGRIRTLSGYDQPLPPPEVITVPHPAPVDYISCTAGAVGHHIDGTPYQCPVDGTVFRCLPGGFIQWVRDGAQWGAMNAVYGTQAPQKDVWTTPVGDPDVFGNLVGAVPGRPPGWTDPHSATAVAGPRPAAVQIDSVPGRAAIIYSA